MTALIILQLIFLFPFTIYFALLLANSLTGQMYIHNKTSYYIGILLLIVTLFALLAPSSGVLSFIIFVDYFYFLYTLFFRNKKVKVAKNPLMVISKTLLLLMPLVILIVMNVYLIQQLSFSNLEMLNSVDGVNSSLTQLIPTSKGELSVIPLATLLLLSSGVLQLISLSVDILLDKIEKNKNENSKF